MAWIAPVVAAGAGIASGAMGASAQGDARQQSKDAFDASVRDYESIGIPTVEAQQIVMEKYKSAGQWTPELEQSVKLGDSNMLGVSTDPTYKDAQLKALGSLQDIGNSGGMNLTDKANLQRTMGDINAQERGNREAILQDAQQRGGYGSGTALAAQLMNQQGGANRANQAGLDTAAQAQARALQAIQSAGQLGGSMQATEFGQKAQQATAQDAISKWNAENAQNVQNTNTGLKNQAAQFNLNNAQNLSNANTDLSNKDQVYNKGLWQQYFNNQMQKTHGEANARAGQANNAIAGGNAAAQTWGNIGSSVAQASTAAGQMANANNQSELDRQAKLKASQSTSQM